MTTFLNLAPTRPGRRAAVALLRERYETWDDCNAVWCTVARSWDEFASLASFKAPYASDPLVPTKPSTSANEMQPIRSVRYSSAIAMHSCRGWLWPISSRRYGAIKAADPNHLALGCRFAYPPQDLVIRIAGRHLDVVSFNCYDVDPGRAIDAFAVSEKPCLIGEFSFRSEDSGLPNTIGTGLVVRTQGDRARCFQDYVVAASRGRASSAITDSNTQTSRPRAALTAKTRISAPLRSGTRSMRNSPGQ